MAAKNTAGRMKGVLALLLAFGPALLLVMIGTRGCEHKFKELDDYGKVVDYSFTDARGKKFSSKNFKKNVVLITTLQTSCPDTCAISFWHLNQHIFRIAKDAKDKTGSLRIISFVTDGEGNPVEDVSIVEEMIKDQVNEYDPDVWYIASGDARPLYDMESNGQTLLEQGDEFFGGEAFQERMLLLDKQNHLRMVHNGNSEGAVRRMKEHVALLQKQYDKEAAKKK